MKTALPWIALAAAVIQFAGIALPPGNADLISIQSLAFDLARGDAALLYPGRDFDRNDAWVAHHEHNLVRLGARGEPNWCFYPPLVPFLLAPLASAPPELWRLLWGVLQFGLIALYALIILRLLDRFRLTAPRRTVWVFALLCGSYAVARNVELGQTSLALAVLLWSGWLFADRFRCVPAGLAIGSALLLKPFLAMALIPALIRRKIGIPAAALAVLILWGVLSLAAVGWRAHADYADLLTTLAASQTAYSGNQSLMAGLLRLTTDWPVMDYGFLPDHGLAVLSRGLALLVFAIAFWAQRRGRESLLPLSIGLWLSAALLALPISWEHHLLFLLPAVAMLWLLPLAPAARATLTAATLLLSAAWVPLYADSGPGRLAASLPLLGNLLLFILIVWIHARPPAAMQTPAALGKDNVRS